MYGAEPTRLVTAGHAHRRSQQGRDHFFSLLGQFRSMNWQILFLLSLFATSLVSFAHADGDVWVIEDLFRVEPTFAIGHRGSGANLGEDPDRPIENTRASVRDAFPDGVTVVEVDVQITAELTVVAWPDDFLPDLLGVMAFTLNSDIEWFFAQSLGVDGIFTDDIPLGLALQGHTGIGDDDDD